MDEEWKFPQNKKRKRKPIQVKPTYFFKESYNRNYAVEDEQNVHPGLSKGEEDIQCLKIHGLYHDDDFPSSDSGASQFDEEYYKYKPPPLVIDKSRIVVIEKEDNSQEENASYSDISARKNVGRSNNEGNFNSSDGLIPKRPLEEENNASSRYDSGFTNTVDLDETIKVDENINKSRREVNVKEPNSTISNGLHMTTPDVIETSLVSKKISPSKFVNKLPSNSDLSYKITGTNTVNPQREKSITEIAKTHSTIPVQQSSELKTRTTRKTQIGKSDASFYQAHSIRNSSIPVALNNSQVKATKGTQKRHKIEIREVNYKNVISNQYTQESNRTEIKGNGAVSKLSAKKLDEQSNIPYAIKSNSLLATPINQSKNSVPNIGSQRSSSDRSTGNQLNWPSISSTKLPSNPDPNYGKETQKVRPEDRIATTEIAKSHVVKTIQQGLVHNESKQPRADESTANVVQAYNRNIWNDWERMSIERNNRGNLPKLGQQCFIEVDLSSKNSSVGQEVSTRNVSHDKNVSLFRHANPQLHTEVVNNTRIILRDDLPRHLPDQSVVITRQPRNLAHERTNQLSQSIHEESLSSGNEEDRNLLGESSGICSSISLCICLRLFCCCRSH